MKLILYALGRVFEQNKEKLDWGQVIAAADKSVVSEGEAYGKPLLPPHAINSLDYDFIVVFSNRFFENIRMNLAGEYFIPQEKIIPWREIVEEDVPVSEVIKYYVVFSKASGCRSILDCGMSPLPRKYMLKEELFPNMDIVFDGIDEPDSNIDLYDNVYGSFNDCTGFYDTAFVWGGGGCTDEELGAISGRAGYILIFTRYFQDGISIKKVMEERLKVYGMVKCISTLYGLLWVVDTRNACGKRPDAAVYVAAHRDYNFKSDSFYRPLCVGGYRREGCLDEQCGENIAHLNGRINECTALYWIWKNTDTEYAGLNHYRRYFYNNEIRSMDNFLDMENMVRILKEYDIILFGTPPSTSTVYEHMRGTMDAGLFREGYELIRGKIMKRQPDYLASFDSVMGRYNFFLCNMFATRREILNRYCEWLFSFLIEAAEEINVEGYDCYSRRVIGFFAERMWTVWLCRNRMRIKVLPCAEDAAR